MIVYKLIAESLTNLGGRMGSDDSTPVILSELFGTKQKAKDYAQEWHTKNVAERNKIEDRWPKVLKWYRYDNYVRSQDCLWVRYSISEHKMSFIVKEVII